MGEMKENYASSSISTTKKWEGKPKKEIWLEKEEEMSPLRNGLAHKNNALGPSSSSSLQTTPLGQNPNFSTEKNCGLEEWEDEVKFHVKIDAKKLDIEIISFEEIE